MTPARSSSSSDVPRDSDPLALSEYRIRQNLLAIELRINQSAKKLTFIWCLVHALFNYTGMFYNKNHLSMHFKYLVSSFPDEKSPETQCPTARVFMYNKNLLFRTEEN